MRIGPWSSTLALGELRRHQDCPAAERPHEASHKYTAMLAEFVARPKSTGATRAASENIAAVSIEPSNSEKFVARFPREFQLPFLVANSAARRVHAAL